MDAIRSIPGGLAQGVAGVAGLPSTAMNFIANKAGDLMGRSEVADTDPNAQRFMGLPTIGQANQAISKPFGGYYEPKTTAGRYTETAASFAPALVGGEASLPSRLLGRVLAPAAGSMAAGSLADANTSPTLHNALQVGGAVLGGGLVAGGRALGQAALSDVPADIQANQYLAKALKQQNITPDTIANSAIPGKGQIGAEAMGPQGVATLATLGRRGGDTGKTLASVLTTRALGAPSRIMDDFTSAAGIDPRAAQGNFDGILAAGKKAAEPLYTEAYKQNNNIASPMLDKILETPAGKQALAGARVKMQNDMSLMGTPDADLIDQAKEGGTLIPKNGVASGMKLRVYDYVKRSLDDQISAAYRAGNKNEGGILVDLKGKLVKALDDADVTAQAGPNSTKPDGGLYAQARAKAGEYLGAQNAYEDGQAHILGTNVSADDVGKYVSKLSPTDLEAYKGGIANKLLLQAGNARLSPRLLNTPAVQQKLAVVIGPDKARQFIQNVQNESSLAGTGARMMPGTGSITSDIGLMTGEQDQAANIAAGMHGLRAVGHAANGNAFGAVGSGLAALRHFAPDMLRSGGLNTDARNQLGKILMLPPDEMAQHMRGMQTIPTPKPSAIGRLLKGNP